jgi:hypothetical protein
MSITAGDLARFRETVEAITTATRLLRDLLRALDDDHCHGIVTRDGEQDACGKPTTCIVDGHGTEDETFWPACTYHANRYGGGRIVPLTVIREVVCKRALQAHGVIR